MEDPHTLSGSCTGVGHRGEDSFHALAAEMSSSVLCALTLFISLTTQVSHSQDGFLAADEKAEEEQENFSDISSVLGNSRHQILAAQFECYLKIIHDPPWIEEGDKTEPIVHIIHSSVICLFLFLHFQHAAAGSILMSCTCRCICMLVVLSE